MRTITTVPLKHGLVRSADGTRNGYGHIWRCCETGIFARVPKLRAPKPLRCGRLEMDHNTKRRSILGTIAIAFAVLSGAALCLFAFVAMTTSVSGTASLPNGTTAVINGQFSCSDIPPTTKIEAGGHTFTFTPTTISVDGIPVGPLDASVTSVQIDASYWSASLRVNGDSVRTFR